MTELLKMKSAHQVLASIPFQVKSLDRGYADRTLRIDVSRKTIEIKPVTRQMKDLWIGGKGFDLWLMFQEVTKETRWDSPENPICFSSGPLGGTASFPGAGKMLVTSLSPTTSSVMDCNVGGNFGPYLKWAGFDALAVVGKSEEEILLFIDAREGRIAIETAPRESVDSHRVAEELTALYARDEDDKRNIAVVSAGRAAESTRLGVLNSSFYDWRRRVARLKQAGRGGIGTVFRKKKIKAIVIRCREMPPPWKVAESPGARFFTDHICRAGTAVATAKVNMIAEKWKNDPEFVIEMMQDIQDEFRYLPKDAVDFLSRKMKLSQGMLYHIATFYKAFTLTPRGETVIQVCLGTACHVQGAPRIMDALERELSIKAGGTTKDGRFTLDGVACLGCCGIAPVVKVGEEIVGNVAPHQVEKLLTSGVEK